MTYYNEQKCDHKQLKYYEKTDKIVCLECGQDFYEELNYPKQPTIPYNPPNPLPDYPIYTTIIWNKLHNTANITTKN